jgi:hypothetical protein
MTTSARRLTLARDFNQVSLPPCLAGVVCAVEVGLKELFEVCREAGGAMSNARIAAAAEVGGTVR